MKIKSLVLVAVFSIGLACVTDITTVSQLDSTETSVFIQESEEAPNEGTDLVKEIDMFYVNIEVVVFAEEIELYPVTWENVQKAIAEWASHIPVRFTIYTEDSTVFEDSVFKNQIGVIEIHLVDLQGDDYGLPEKLLGLWYSHGQEVLLDADTLEEKPEKAYSVALHELGHLFGVPHIIGISEMGLTGYVVLAEGVDPTNYVMYPHSVRDNPQKTLSNLEIMLAHYNLVHYWTRPSRDRKIDSDCDLFSLDK